MAKTPNLVIVESPSKAKTIGKYLGSDYQVKACMGHLRDLPKSKLGVDLEHDFEPVYQPLKEKSDLIRELRTASDAAERVYLATDPDREGEAISWHLKELLQLSDEKAARVTFNEITNKVVCEAIRAPRAIDSDLVDAQQARRILDRIVGYQLSPLLWKKVRRGLSAGRVQSVATRMVVDREEEIRAFQPEEYWSVDAHLERIGKAGSFIAHYHGEEKKRELHSLEEVQALLRDIDGGSFTVKNIKRGEKKKQPSPPFITSTLQQEASRKCNMTPKRTMAIAQQLYEGVDITGVGTVGLITYMRTDSLRLSEEALAAAKDFIIGRYGASYYNGKPRVFRSSSNAQDAHEAIRPSNVQLDPEQIQSNLTRDQYKLYKLIWSRFVASQMAPAVYETTAIDAQCRGHIFRANHQALRFSGCIAVYEEGRDDEQEEKQTPLPDLQMDEPLRCSKTEQEQHFTQPPPRYTEATLVRAMEEKGVGRPSTYAATISTIQDRDYVEKKDKRLYPTALGEVITGMMKQRFRDIIDVEFTAHMEQSLDEVEAGKLPWKNVLRSFYSGFDQELKDAEATMERLKVPDEETDEVCELCGRKMVIKSGRFGKFLACPGFPECKNTRPLSERMPGRCPKCGSTILKLKSKKGYTFYSCERGQDCGFMSWDVPTENDCPSCGQTMFKKAGRGAMKSFCINPECPQYLPEEQRGYRRKTQTAPESGTDETPQQGTEEPAKKAAKKTAKKSGTGRTAAKKKADGDAK